MSDLSKLPAAPWRAQWQMSGDHNGHNLRCKSETSFGIVAKAFSMNDAEGIALLRNALDVQLRRGWTAHRCRDAAGNVSFWVDGEDRGDGGFDADDWHPGPFAQWLEGRTWPDPATALCAAEAWYVANCEGK